MIALRADAIGQHLRWDMAVAEMPGEPRQDRDIGGTHLDQRLRRGHYFDQTAVIEQQQIVGAQARRLVQIDLELAALDADDGRLLRAALGVVENNSIDDRPTMPIAGLKDACCAQHGREDLPLS